ncbi:MAG: hypothetical protein UZ11_BCD004001347 [Bacteroidetes bacterium OLB11]|nr:MAG: hypothetical protein UZ11_BCD004001347 [Bacteroidetes bacterium OLB11]
MKFYRQIQQFLIERYPIIWNTHFIPILFIGFSLHLLYFYLGYFNLDYLFLKQFSISNLFYTNYSFGIYSIICLLAFIYFGFRFFTHNSFLNFYPIEPLYFWKNFAIIFTLIFVFLTVSVSFENGMKAKLDKLLPEKQRNKMIEDINMAYPFLFNDVNQYQIDQRVYPDPFPLTELSRTEANDDGANQIRRTHGINFEKPYLNFNGRTYQFGHLQEIKLDSCNSKVEVKDYVDVSGVDNLQEYSFYNFSRIYISKDDANLQYSLDDISKYNHEYQYIEIAPKLHQIYKNKDQKAIETILFNLIEQCKKISNSSKFEP